MDSDRLIQCPYDKNHQVRPSRLPYHLVKCQRNNPQVASSMAVCPFNARHRVPHAQLQSHAASCPDKRRLHNRAELHASLGRGVGPPEPATAWECPPCQEDWEEELTALEAQPPFIFQAQDHQPALLDWQVCSSVARSPELQPGTGGTPHGSGP